MVLLPTAPVARASSDASLDAAGHIQALACGVTPDEQLNVVMEGFFRVSSCCWAHPGSGLWRYSRRAAPNVKFVLRRDFEPKALHAVVSQADEV